MEVFKVHILESVGGKIANTLVFSGENESAAIHPDDSIRTIKMKILYELQKASKRPSYEEVYLYAFTQEETTTLQLFDSLGDNQAISRDVIVQMLEGHPESRAILDKLPKGDKIAYSEFEEMLSEKKLTLSVKMPLGIQFARGRRDASFEVDPFAVETHRAYLTEHNNFHYFDDSLLLNYGAITENTIYVCLADSVYDSIKDSAAEEYVTRYYFPGLYKAGVSSKETLAGKRQPLVKHTAELLTDARLQYYQSIQTFYQIATDKETSVHYVSRGIQHITLRLTNATSRTTNLELLFRNMHCRKEIPYIKFNPGNRRENLYRFYFERTTRTGKKIPYLSRSHIMRLSKETGKAQQISAYLESVVLSEPLVANCYAHFERSGDVQLQVSFSKPVDERTLERIMSERVIPQLSLLAADVKPTGFVVPEYAGMRDQLRTQIVDMEIVVKVPAKKQVTWETVPCIYSICTLNVERIGDAPTARLKRVENFKEMDAARILVAEMYGEVQFGELTLQDIVDELVSRKLVETDDAARVIIADALTTMNELNGEIVERPGFPLQLVIDVEEKIMEIRVSDITSIRYLDTLSVYIDAIVKTTQLMAKKSPLLTKLNLLCKKARKFKEVETVQELAPALLREAVSAPSVVATSRKQELDYDFFAQFADDDEEEEEYRGAPAIETETRKDQDDEFDNLLDKLHQNVKPFLFDDSDEEDDGIEVANTPLEPLEALKPLEVPPARRKPMFFDDSDDEEEEEDNDDKEEQYNLGGAKKRPSKESDDDEEDSNEDGDETNLLAPDGKISLKPVNPILKRLRRRDPVLFKSKPNGQYTAYSVSCQPTSRHPVILTQEEFDKTDKSAYVHSVKYGSDPNNQHHFICPRFWCFRTNSAISEEDVKLGKCGKIIPKGEKTVPNGAYVYELNQKGVQYPGFIENARPDGKCLPCCFKNWDGKNQREARERCHKQMIEGEGGPSRKPATDAISNKTAQYIYSLDTYPVPEKRWGYLPIPVQLFLAMDYRSAVDPNNPALLKPKKPVLLRCGVEQPTNQSFLGVFAHLYAHRQDLASVPSVDAFRQILLEAIDIDIFARAHNGSLLSAFYPKSSANASNKKATTPKEKHTNSEFALSLDLSNKSQKRYFDDAVVAYEHFREYLLDSQAIIDHQYLWDLVCGDNAKIMPRGLNLVILEIKANDIIDRIELVCPTNLYSSNQYDSAKDTVILLKHDDIYEPVFLYESNATIAAPTVVRFFESKRMPHTISEVLKNVEMTTKRYCPGLPSLPKIYKFANPMPIQNMLPALDRMKAKVESQVVNYQGKTIGLMVSESGATGSLYVPCAPTTKPLFTPQNKKIRTIYMDDLDIPKDYTTTVAKLNRISQMANIPCRPVWKIKEEGLIVGFLTETNQFVPIRPNEDIVMDDLRIYEGVNTFDADKTVATTSKGDRTREKMTRFISLESQFYHAFRNRVRILLNQFANRKRMNDIKRVTDDQTILYSQKIAKLESMISDLIEDYVVFVDIDKSVLMDMAIVNDCDDSVVADGKSPNCILKENGIAQLVVPKWHLLSKYDNEKIYVGRIADELIRNDRVKAFMYDAVNRLNAKNVDYSIHLDEFILVQSALTPEYFSEFDSTKSSQYAKQTNYELANPSISVAHPNEKIPLDEQYQASDEPSGDVNNCIVNKIGIKGNKLQIWSRIFSEDAREWVYHDTIGCTFQPVMKIAGESIGEKWTERDVRRKLAAAYASICEKTPGVLSKIVGVMRKQGKSKMLENIARNAKMDSALSDFEGIVMSDNYYLSDMDFWVLATEYKLPIIMFNPNGFKGFFAKTDVQWIKMCTGQQSAKYHFIRSNVGSYANQIYKYNLIVPAVKLENTKEFEAKVVESAKAGAPNTYGLVEALSKIAFAETRLLKAKK